jgi:hypothetical protein
MTLYINVIFQPNIAGKSAKEASFTNGEDIKNAKVTPIGTPALRKPMKRGIEEQEQNGVTTPNIAAIT